MRLTTISDIGCSFCGTPFQNSELGDVPGGLEGRRSIDSDYNRPPSALVEGKLRQFFMCASKKRRFHGL